MLIVMYAQMIANNPLISQTDPDVPHLAKSESFVSISCKVLLPFHKTGPEINCNGQNFQRFFPPENTFLSDISQKDQNLVKCGNYLFYSYHSELGYFMAQNIIKVSQ